MSDPEQELLEKIRRLSQACVAEVQDFVEFLQTRQQDEPLSQAASKISEPAFAAVWDNDEDAVYDRY